MSKARILIVEDEAIVALDLKRALNKLGYSVLELIRYGEEAINYVNSAKPMPDVILMDIMLAGELNGTSAAAEIMKLKNIPVIYITAYSDSNTFTSARLTNPFGYILKPFDERMLYISIEMAIYKHALEYNLQESEKRYRHLVENSPIGICIVSDDRFVYTNPSAVKILGAADEPEVNAAKFAAIFGSDILSGKDNHLPVQKRIKSLNGETKEVELSAVATYYKDAPAFHIIIKDISEIIKKEKLQGIMIRILQAGIASGTLDELYYSLKEIIGNIFPGADFYFAFYNEGRYKRTSVPSGKYDDTSYIRFERKVIERRQPLEVKGNELKQESKSSNAKCRVGIPVQIQQGVNGVIILENYEFENCFSDDEKEIIKLIAYPIARAIEKRINEIERNANTRKLKELNKSKDKFFSLISHDLRSPFNSILGFMEILKNEYNSLTEEERTFFINSVYGSAKNIYDQLNDLLEYSRSKLNNSFMPEKVNINQVITKAIKIHAGHALKKEITINKDIPENIFAYAEESMMVSVFQNIISNAVKFTERGGEVSISSRRNKLFIETDICDSGIGVSEKKLASLFKLEEKISTPGTEDEPGTGLGLLLVKELVEKNGGNVKVESSPGSGSKFTVRIPVADAKTTM
jgi:PAS domain S-box-containing protein